MAAKVTNGASAAASVGTHQSSSSSNSTPNSSSARKPQTPKGIKTPMFNKSASLPEHILDNVSSPLSKIDQAKLANAVAVVSNATQHQQEVAPPDGGADRKEGSTRRDSALSVEGLSFNAVGSRVGAHCSKLSWDSNNGAESGTELIENGVSGGSDYSNLEVVSADSKIGRLFSKHFPDLGEVPIKHANYSCSLLVKDSIPYHGRLYLTPAWICFYSKLFKKQLAVPLREVIMIKKEKSAFVVPNAIKVVSHTQKLLFGSLFHRHITFKLMTVLWSRNCCDRALIDYDQMSLDSTTDKPTSGASVLNENDEEDDSLLDSSVSISADMGKLKSESFSVGSYKSNIDAIFSPSHVIRDDKANADVSSSAEEMVSADERTLFGAYVTNGAGAAEDSSVKSRSSPPRSGDSLPPDPCEDEDDYGDDRCSTVVRVNTSNHRGASSSEEKKLIVASNTSSSAGVMEQMSEPYQLTATVRYRPISSSNSSSAPLQTTLATVSSSHPRPTHMGGATPLGGSSHPGGAKKTAAVIAALSSDSGSPPTETRTNRRNDYHQSIQGTRMDKGGGGGSSRGGGVRSRNEGGGAHLQGDDQSPHPRMVSTAGQQHSTPNRIVMRRDSSEPAIPPNLDFTVCHQCQMNRLQSVSYEGLYLLLFTIVLFFLLVTSLVLIWQLHHLPKSLHHHHRHHLTQPLTHQSQQYEQNQQFSSASSHPSQFGSEQKQKGGEYDEILMSANDPLVQLVLQSCAMKQATSEYLATTIEANNLLLNGINSQLERVAKSFEVSQANIEELVQLKLEEQKRGSEQKQKCETPSHQPETATQTRDS